MTHSKSRPCLRVCFPSAPCSLSTERDTWDADGGTEVGIRWISVFPYFSLCFPPPIVSPAHLSLGSHCHNKRFLWNFLQEPHRADRGGGGRDEPRRQTQPKFLTQTSHESQLKVDTKELRRCGVLDPFDEERS